MAIIDFNSVSGVSTVTATSSIRVGSGVTITSTSIVGVSTVGVTTIFVGTGASISSPATNVLTLGTNNTESVRIDSSGRVGIGTNNIGSNTKLHIKNSAVDDYVRVEHESNDTQLRIQVSSTQSRVQLSATYNSTGSYYPLAFLTSDTERFRIASNGAWGLSGANYGSSGQLLTSNGSGSAPTWQTLSTLGSSSQSWTNVTASRATGTTYTNSTGAPIFVVVTPTASANLIGTFNINGSSVGFVQFTPAGGGGGSPFFYVIPNGATYSVTNNSNYGISSWWELR